MQNSSGFALRLREDVELRAMQVPGEENPYLGILHGTTFVALAQFLSVADMEFLSRVLRAHAIVIAPATDMPTPGDYREE